MRIAINIFHTHKVTDFLTLVLKNVSFLKSEISYYIMFCTIIWVECCLYSIWVY